MSRFTALSALVGPDAPPHCPLLAVSTLLRGTFDLFEPCHATRATVASFVTFHIDAEARLSGCTSPLSVACRLDPSPRRVRPDRTILCDPRNRSLSEIRVRTEGRCWSSCFRFLLQSSVGSFVVFSPLDAMTGGFVRRVFPPSVLIPLSFPSRFVRRILASRSARDWVRSARSYLSARSGGVWVRSSCFSPRSPVSMRPSRSALGFVSQKFRVVRYCLHQLSSDERSATLGSFRRIPVSGRRLRKLDSFVGFTALSPSSVRMQLRTTRCLPSRPSYAACST